MAWSRCWVSCNVPAKGPGCYCAHVARGNVVQTRGSFPTLEAAQKAAKDMMAADDSYDVKTQEVV